MTLPKFAYFQGKIVPYSEAKVGVMTHALNYGTGAFGGIRGYWNPEQEQLYIFRPKDHLIRLFNSAKLLLAEVDCSQEDLIRIMLELVRKEGYNEDIYIRPLIYKADEIIGVKLHGLRDEITVFAIPFSRYIEKDEGAHVTFSSWRRRLSKKRRSIDGGISPSARSSLRVLRSSSSSSSFMVASTRVVSG